MTDIHDNDDNTPSRGNERVDFDLNPDYNEYGIQPLDDGAVILRIDSEKHLFERAGLLRHKQAKIVLKEYIDSENLGGEGSFEAVESVSTRRDDVEPQLRDEIVELIYEGKVDKEQARSLSESVAGSFTE
jgi:hypothetical protein